MNSRRNSALPDTDVLAKWESGACCSVTCKLSSSGLEAGGEDYREILEEECGGVAITPDEPIKDPLVTLGELALGGAQILLASAAASGEEWVGREKAANCTSASAARRCGREEKKGVLTVNTEEISGWQFPGETRRSCAEFESVLECGWQGGGGNKGAKIEKEFGKVAFVNEEGGARAAMVPLAVLLLTGDAPALVPGPKENTSASVRAVAAPLHILDELSCWLQKEKAKEALAMKTEQIHFVEASCRLKQKLPEGQPMTLELTPRKAEMTRNNHTRAKRQFLFHLSCPTAATVDQGEKQLLKQLISDILQSGELYSRGHCNSIALLTSRGNESLLWRGKYGAAYSSQRAQLMSRQQLGTVATSLPALCLHAHRKICPQQIWVSTSCTSLTLAKF
ncbi:hypothetical protein Anapl_08678 [Anas platyrhynchos]|uniref:Uncharacterized protein n=1 Tax=Anas platyrhynchos TaxID=8839 RepID=R0LMK5_ANAPL|nr:hypothetical protein Anapl_08678 [Anas platyrhynchos]